MKILWIVCQDLSCYVFIIQNKEIQDLFTHFNDFWSQIEVVILVTVKQEIKRKSKWFCGVKFFHSNFKVEWENGVWIKIRFLTSGFFVLMRQFHFDFYWFFDFLDLIF